VLERLKVLSDPDYRRGPFDEVFQVRLDTVDGKRAVWRTIHVPANYTFWDLYVAIVNSIGLDCHWTPRFEVTESANLRRTALDFDLWETRLEEYLSPKHPSCDCTIGHWDIHVELQEVLAKDPKTDYPLLIGGSGWIEGRDWFVEDHWKWRSELEGRLPDQLDENGLHDVVFDDPDDAWIYFCCEEPLLGESLEDFFGESRDVPPSEEPLAMRIPSRYREVLVALRIVNPDQIIRPGYDPPIPATITMLADRQQLCEINDNVVRRIETATDVRLMRRLQRLEWYFRSVIEMVS
jgi:hypothetical protein